MISRRLLRIKVLHILYAYYISSGNLEMDKAEKELHFSIKKSFDLFISLLVLMSEIIHFAERKMEQGMDKKLPSFEDLHPNTKFIENQVIKKIFQDNGFNQLIQKNKINWVNYPELIKNLYEHIIQSEIYLDYINTKDSSFSEDKKFIINLYEKEIAQFDLIYQALEEQSIYWNDDVELIISMIIRMIGKYKGMDDEHLNLPELYKNEEDKEFVVTLFRQSIMNFSEYRDLIEKYTKYWDVERIALMDMVIMIQALTEITYFPMIPLKVSLDEYIEISKCYSTSKSAMFINGVLDKIIQQLREEKKIIKKGKGLIGGEI